VTDGVAIEANITEGPTTRKSITGTGTVTVTTEETTAVSRQDHRFPNQRRPSC
jgi:hypothetical protein